MNKLYPNGSGTVAAVFGHPLHPMVVPLPIGAFILALVSDAIGFTTGDPFWTHTSFFLIAAGVVTGALAGLIGLVELVSLRRARTMGLAWAHGIVNVIALAIAFFSLLIRREGWGTDNPLVGYPQLISAAVVVLLLLISGWLGGELSYRHGVGVSESVGSEREDGDPERTPAGRPDLGKL